MNHYNSLWHILLLFEPVFTFMSSMFPPASTVWRRSYQADSAAYLVLARARLGLQDDRSSSRANAHVSWLWPSALSHSRRGASPAIGIIRHSRFHCRWFDAIMLEHVLERPDSTAMHPFLPHLPSPPYPLEVWSLHSGEKLTLHRLQLVGFGREVLPDVLPGCAE